MRTTFLKTQRALIYLLAKIYQPRVKFNSQTQINPKNLQRRNFKLHDKFFLFSNNKKPLQTKIRNCCQNKNNGLGGYIYIAYVETTDLKNDNEKAVVVGLKSGKYLAKHFFFWTDCGCFL